MAWRAGRCFAGAFRGAVLFVGVRVVVTGCVTTGVLVTALDVVGDGVLVLLTGCDGLAPEPAEEAGVDGVRAMRVVAEGLVDGEAGADVGETPASWNGSRVRLVGVVE